MTTGTVTGSIQFAKWQDIYYREKPFMIFMDIPRDSPDQRFSNVEFTSSEVEIHDIRGNHNAYTLDEHGFRILVLNNASKYHDHGKFETEYLPAIRTMLHAEVEGVDRVVFFDWRRRNSAVPHAVNALDDRNEFLKPANTAHVDQAPIAALNRVKEQLGAEADRLMRGRIRIINIWRPVQNAVTDWPLAFCDGRTVRKDDFLEVDQVRKTHIGSSMFMLHNERMKWHYLKDQRPDEVLVFKQFDSLSDVEARFCPHSAFQPKGIPEGLAPRESIEVRALVFTEPLDSTTN